MPSNMNPMAETRPSNTISPVIHTEGAVPESRTESDMITPLVSPAKASRERHLVERRVIAAATPSSTPHPSYLVRHKARREVFQLTGRYFSEAEAREILRQILEHRWIEAEKAGRDIWVERDPSHPMRAASHDWFSRFFENWRKTANFGSLSRLF